MNTARRPIKGFIVEASAEFYKNKPKLAISLNKMSSDCKLVGWVKLRFDKPCITSARRTVDKMTDDDFQRAYDTLMKEYNKQNKGT